MAAHGPRQHWRRACTRGAIIGIVAASHLVLLGWMLAPPKPRLRGGLRAAPHADGVLQVELLAPAMSRTGRPSLSQVTPTSPARVPVRPPGSRTAKVARPLQGALAPAPASSAPRNADAAFVAGGDFDARLRRAQAAPGMPKLPGGRHYMAADLAFVPMERQSIEGKMQQVSGLLFGGFDPVCRNLEHEQAKPRAQQIADGYTREELERRLREYHCR